MSIDFDIKDKAFQEDPHAKMKELRAQCPVHHAQDDDFYIASRYEDIKAILRDTNLWSSRFGPGTAFADPDAPNALVNVDPPEHDFHLRLVNKSFTRSSIDDLEPEIQTFIDTLIADLKPRGECDLMRDFAVHLPLFVISKMLGVDSKDGPMFRSWVEKLTLGVFNDGDPKVLGQVGADLAAYFSQEIATRQARIDKGEALSDDLITRLMTSEVEGRTLEPARIIGFISFLLIAGSGTTTMLICNAVDEILKRPDQLAKLIADPDTLIPALIEEAMRFRSPVHGLFRTNNEPVTLQGVDIPKESKVMCMFASANMDEEQFENAETFNIERDMREMRKHLGFGWGTHICIGAPLARMEARIALTAILTGLPGLRANGPGTQTEPNVLYGFDHLPVVWDVT